MPAPASAAELGGFTLTAQAAPVAIQIFEPMIPIPAEPQLELNLSYSRATLSSGPTGRAVSSLLWPGDGVAYGLPELAGNPDVIYPVKVEAAHPSGPEEAEQELAPGSGMTAHAGEAAVEAAAAIAKPAVPALPVPGVPIPPMLVAIESFSSQSTTTVADATANAKAYATAGSISLLGGLVKIDGLRADTEATSNGVDASTAGTVVWSSLTVAGQTFAVSQDGVASPLGTTAVPELPQAVAKRMADFGLTIEVPSVESTKDGAGAVVTGRGLTVTLDTAVMRSKLDLGWLLDPFLALLPADLRTQVMPWLEIAPKIAFILGFSTSQAVATPPFDGGSAPPPVLVGSSGVGGLGSSTGGGFDPTPVSTGTALPVAASQEWPVFGGVPWYLFVLGAGMAAAVAYGLRRYVGLMFAAGGCERGAPHGIPNLRER